MTKLVSRDWSPRQKRVKPGAVPEGRIGIYTHDLNRRGHMGMTASAVTAARFGVQNATLQRVRGAPAWVGASPKARTAPRVSAVPLAKSLRAAKGSNR
jgi:hypothetical protein